MDEHQQPTAGAGDDVEVWNRYIQAWTHGFAIADGDDRGYRLRRMSDGAVLPTPFAADRMRVGGRSARMHRAG